MRNVLMAAVAAAGLLTATVAMADEFAGQQSQAVAAAAAVDRQATSSSLADPTDSTSLRSHGRP